MRIIASLSILVFLLHMNNAQNFQDDNPLEGQLSIIVEDNLGKRDGGPIDKDVWSERSIITVRSVKLGDGQFTHTRTWNKDHVERLKEFSGKRGFYKLRLRQSSKDSAVITTFTDACLYYNAMGSEIINLLIDSSPQLGGISNSLISASLTTPYGTKCTDNTIEEEPHHDKKIKSFNTTLVFKTASSPTQPDTATFIQRMETINKEKMENKDNRSFFAKYWMYIVPVVILLAMSGGGDPGNR